MSSKSENINNIIDENEKISNEPNKVIFDTAVFAVDFTKASRKFWYIILIISLLFGFSAGYLKYVGYTPMYESSVSFSVTSVSYSSSGTAVFASYYDNNSAAQLSKTFPYIVNTPMMRNALKNELKTSYINGSITASSVATDSNIFKVTVRSNSAEDAYKIINAVINVYPDVALFVVGNVNLKILIQPTLPTEPYTVNNFIRIGLMMALIGLILGFCLVAVYAFFRNTIRKKDDFKNKLNQKCFVEIPYVTFYRTSKKENKNEHIVRINDRHPTFKESFRLLRKRLMRHLHSNEKVIGISAPVYGEGKTMVSLNLAHTLAISHKKTACVDFDIKSRSLQKYLRINKGFTDVINQSNPDFSSVCHKEDEYLDIFAAGDSPFEYNNSDCERFFDYLRSNYDYIIVNLAPVKDVSGSVSISNLCDCLMFVTFQDKTSIDKIRKSIEIMSFSTARILGFIFNGVQDGFSGYGGYYYGGKYGYGKYGYGRYGYGKKYGYGSKYGYGKKYGYGYGYGYGEKHKKHRHGYGYGYGYGYEEDDSNQKHENTFIDDIDDNDIPDNT